MKNTRFIKAVRARGGGVRPAVVLCVVAVLLIASVESRSAKEAAADFLASNIDSTVSPREDFYQYANGGWLKRNPIPEGIGSGASEEVYQQVREISETAAAMSAARGTANQLIGAVWATGMDTAAINAQGLTPLQPDLNRIDGIRSLADLIDVVAILHRRRMLIDDWFLTPTVLFAGAVQPDESQSDRGIYKISAGGLSVGRLVYSATDSQRVRVRGALREYLFKTFIRLGRDSDKAHASADAVYNIEAQLASAFGSSSESHRMELAQLMQATPAIDWNRYFRGIGVNTIGSIEVANREFFAALDSMLRMVPLEDWKDYLRFSLIKLNAPFLDDATYGEFFALKSVASQRSQPDLRWKRVVWQEKNWLGLPLKKLWIEKYFDKDAASRYETVGESIRRAFRKRIDHLEWMSDRTKRQALLKLSRLKLTVGLPEQGIDFSTMPLQRDSYVLNMIRSAEWFHEQEIKMLGPAIVPANLDLQPEVGGDSEYDVHANEVRIQHPEFAPGLRDNELDDAFVYGTTPLGHEIAHALDSNGRHYDAFGNKVDWWTTQDAATFDKRAAALIDEYSQFTTRDGLHLDGKSALAENMADLVGVRVKLDAFKKTAQFARNERVGGFTPLQRFFLAYAYQYRFPEVREAPGGGYAPRRYRVNGVLMNIPEFYEAFGVKPGDPMYRPESARVKIW